MREGLDRHHIHNPKTRPERAPEAATVDDVINIPEAILQRELGLATVGGEWFKKPKDWSANELVLGDE